MSAPIIIPRTRYVLRADNPPRAAIGVDPGKEGAIVLLVDCRVRWAIWWKTAQQNKRQGFRAWWWTPDGPLLDKWASTWPWAMNWPLTVPDGVGEVRATVEAVHGQAGKSGFEVLAEYAGRALYWCEEMELSLTERPPATTWRADVLKLPSKTDAATAEQVALDTLLGHPSGGRAITIAPPVEGPLPIDLNGHVAEAILMALWGAGYRAQPETVTTPGKRGSR